VTAAVGGAGLLLRRQPSMLLKWKEGEGGETGRALLGRERGRVVVIVAK
jgi:hypothetical protein